ncbi:MAG: domain S-box protein [Solirubrobacterales bacterium]|nr:domain S-box protein [Solirubrobacterales bacterium]
MIRNMDLGHARKILNVSHSAFISMDDQGRITYWNIRAEETFGRTREQTLGESVIDLIVPERYREPLRRGFRRFKEGGVTRLLDQRTEQVAVRADGSEFPIELIVSAVREDDQLSFHAFITDISERREQEAERQRLLDELERALAGSEQRLRAIVDSLAEAITIRGRDDHLIYANRAALDRLGIATPEELAAADPHALMGPYLTTAEDGSEIGMEDLPSVRLLRGEIPEPLLMRTLDRRTGEEQWVLLKATAVRDPAGEIEAAVTIIEDVTVSKRMQLRSDFLARAGTVLASSLDYQQTLRNVAGLAVPQIADWCGVDLFDEDGQRERVAVAHVDPERLEMASQLRAYEPDDLDPEQGVGLVLRTSEPALYNEITDELLVGAAVDEEHLRLLRAVGMRAVLIVPMVVRGRTIGTLTLVSAESGRTFDEGDVEFAGQIAERAALAVENARLYSERSEIARTLQNSLLPEALPELPEWEIAALYRPAGQESEVGGDFYDFWDADGDWLMIIGDVTGKGVHAAAVTSLVRHAAWTASEFDPRPSHLLERINAALRRRPALSVCTALCLRIHGSQATVASGGHPLLWRLGERGVEEVGRHGTLLGAFARVQWPEESFEMQPGETLVAITDGVTDTLGRDDERFGSARLRELLMQVRRESPAAIRERVIAALEQFQVGAQADDTALVVMRRAAQPAAVEQRQALAGHGAGV